MKNFKRIVLLLVCVLLLNGCVKMHTTMTIGNDKSMVYESEILIADQMAGDEEATINETQREELKKEGFTLENLKKDGYTGYKITKKFDNIDELSANNGEEVTISDFTDSEFDNSKLFKLEKGFFKNKYTASFKFNASSAIDDNDISLDVEDDTDVEENIGEVDTDAGASEPVEKAEEANATAVEETETIGALEIGNETTDDTESSFDFSGLEEISQLAAEMEVTFTVNLPSKALTNNAKTVENDGKTLKWSLSAEGGSDINFSFELLNITNILICGGVVLLLIVVIVIIIVKKGKKKEDFTPTIVNETVEGQAPINATSSEEVVNSIETVAESDEIHIEAPTEIPTMPIDEPSPIVPEAPVMDAPVLEPPVMEEPTPVLEAPADIPLPPEAPETPEIPEVPEMPEVPAAPEIPEAPAAPEAPVVEQTPTDINPM